MFNETRVTGDMSIMDTMVAMSDGNPGAVQCLGEVMAKGAEIDPENMLGGLGAVLSLDSYGIYGSPIYVLWSDQCKRDTREFLMLLRAVQLGFLSRYELKDVSDDQTGHNRLTPEHMDKLNEQVMSELDEFQPREEMV